MSCPEYGCFAEFYDHVVPYRSRPDLDFYVAIAREADGPVLEVGCGTGRVLLPCARAGAEMVGLDLSPDMLAVLRRGLAGEPADVQARVRVVEGDMRTFDLDEAFPVAVLPFRSFQHMLTPEDQRAALRRIRAHLRPGGRIVLDLFNPSIPMLGDAAWAKYPVPEPEFTMPDGRRVTRSFRVLRRDYVHQVQHVELIVDVVHADAGIRPLAQEIRGIELDMGSPPAAFSADTVGHLRSPARIPLCTTSRMTWRLALRLDVDGKLLELPLFFQTGTDTSDGR